MIKKIYKKCVQHLSWAISENLNPHRTLQEMLRTDVCLNGNVMHALMTLRFIRNAAKRSGREIGGVILELGGFSHPGLALAMLLMGADKYYLNSMGPVRKRLPLDYAQNICFFMELGLLAKRKLSDVADLIPGGSEIQIKDERLIVLPSQDAGKIDLPDNSIDFIFSITVLEHMPTTDALIRNSLRMLKPNGWAYHQIDLRDHESFGTPLTFLKYGEEEFRKRQPVNNRMRQGDHRRAFERAGFEILFGEYFVPIPMLGNNVQDSYQLVSTPLDESAPTSLDQVVPWVTEEMRKSFQPSFHCYNLRDLSITGVNFAVRKPA